MKCPIDTDIDLVMTDRSGVEIDYCPKCRGVWLDRGELDKLIERASGPAPAQAAQQPVAPQPQVAPQQPMPTAQPGMAAPPPQRWSSSPSSYDRYRSGGGYPPYKRKSILKEIFDF
jgi:Zn-finger nucleic acid-binding protein